MARRKTFAVGDKVKAAISLRRTGLPAAEGEVGTVLEAKPRMRPTGRYLVVFHGGVGWCDGEYLDAWGPIGQVGLVGVPHATSRGD